MSKKRKKLIIIMSICLAVLIIIVGMLIISGIKEKKTEDALSEDIDSSTIQSELEVIEEEPAKTRKIPIKKEEASYEEWLASGMIVGISLYYPEYEFIDIYLASETTLDKYEDSEGVYIIFTAKGKKIAIHSKPLAGERMEAGTVDLYTKDLGFATFDEVDQDSIDTKSCQKIGEEELSNLIDQSMLVSIYEH